VGGVYSAINKCQASLIDINLDKINNKNIKPL